MVTSQELNKPDNKEQHTNWSVATKTSFYIKHVYRQPTFLTYCKVITVKQYFTINYSIMEGINVNENNMQLASSLWILDR